MPTDPYTGTEIGANVTAIRCANRHENLFESWMEAGGCAYPECEYRAKATSAQEATPIAENGKQGYEPSLPIRSKSVWADIFVLLFVMGLLAAILIATIR